MFSGGQKKTLVRKGLRLLRIFWNSKIIWEGFFIWVLYWRGVHRILSNNSGSAFLRIWLAAESHELFSQKRFIIDNLQVSKYASVLTDDKYSEEIDFWFVCVCVCVCVYVCVCVCVCDVRCFELTWVFSRFLTCQYFMVTKRSRILKQTCSLKP